MNVLLNRFHLNGHTTGFRPQTQELELHSKQIAPCQSTAEEVSFEWSHNRISTTDSFSCGCTRVNGPYSDLEFRFYSSSYNFKSSGLR